MWKVSEFWVTWGIDQIKDAQRHFASLKANNGPKYSFHPHLLLSAKCPESVSKHRQWVGNCFCFWHFDEAVRKSLLQKIFSHFSNTNKEKFPSAWPQHASPYSQSQTPLQLFVFLSPLLPASFPWDTSRVITHSRSHYATSRSGAEM